jgi:Predicted ATPase of the PP-loop superfamily implicated in cell cycle control
MRVRDVLGKGEVLKKKVARRIGSAISDFSMIGENDRILVGLSGGKDSGLLLYALGRLRDRSPVRFEVRCLTIDPTTDGRNLDVLRRFASSLDIPMEVVRHPIFGVLAANPQAAPCSLCANLRRGILASYARECGCGVLALGHHRDDVVETVFLNLLYAGRFGAFHPHMRMSRSGVRVIRPLVYVPEREIAEQAEALGLPLVDFQCPYAADTRRAEVKALLSGIAAAAPDLAGNVLHALKRSADEGGWGRCEGVGGPEEKEDDDDFD